MDTPVKPVKSVQIQSYIEQLNEREKKALEVAKRCLETSFDMEKTVGFQTWLKTQN